MLVRDLEGRLIIVYRNDCKNEHVYNEKLYNINFGYTTKYKSVTINPPKYNVNCKTKELKDLSDD